MLKPRNQPSEPPQPGGVTYSLSIQRSLDPNESPSVSIQGYPAENGLLSNEDRDAIIHDVEQALLMMYGKLEQNMGDLSNSPVARTMIFGTGRVRLWLAGFIESRQQGDWLKERLDAAKSIVDEFVAGLPPA